MVEHALLFKEHDVNKAIKEIDTKIKGIYVTSTDDIKKINKNKRVYKLSNHMDKKKEEQKEQKEQKEEKKHKEEKKRENKDSKRDSDSLYKTMLKINPEERPTVID